ncbi:MAG: pilin glycosylation ligase domain-containing protein [Leptothrix sp. (in: b-proteobacteria)]
MTSVQRSGAWLLGLVAIGLPMLIASSTSPTSTFFNQWLAALGAGFWLLWWARGQQRAVVSAPGASVWALLLALALLLAATLVSSAPLGQRLIPAGCLLLAAVLAAASARSARMGDDSALAAPLMLALLVAGGLSVLVALVQVFVPALADGVLVAYPTTPGRAIGNMRQPNQLSTLLLWACAAAVWLGVSRRWAFDVLAALLVALVLAVVLTASRTGLVGVILLALWGVIDRRLPGKVRLLLLLMLPLYALGWWGMEQWSVYSGDVFYGDDQIKKTLHGDPSSSRGKIWSNTLAMIAAHPWRGVGAGAYNFIWTMTPFPDRPIAFFDHSHNLPLQLAVESGIPFALAVLAAFGAVLWLGRKALVSADDARARGARTALFMLVMVSVHSLLEYPLWYVYFLLPTAVLAGWYAGAGDVARHAPAPIDSAMASLFDSWLGQTQPMPRDSRAFNRWVPTWQDMRPSPLAWRTYLAAGWLTVMLSAWALAEYWTVVVIFEPQLALGAPVSLDERIQRGQRSVLFGHHADYAAVTMAEQPETVFASFERPLYHLLDSRLMIAYARALAARGELERARHVAARLREFRNPAADEFFAPCHSSEAGAMLAFQCGDDPALPAEALRPAGR